jgi:hypothetical protein
MRKKIEKKKYIKKKREKKLKRKGFSFSLLVAYYGADFMSFC